MNLFKILDKRFSIFFLNFTTNSRIHNSLNHQRNVHLSKLLCFAEKYTIQILPEVDQLLESGNMKHRKHPGVRGKTPIALPEKLVHNAYKLIPHEKEKLVLEEAKALCSYLSSRRLPIEVDEIQRRLISLFPSIDEEYSEMFEPAKKEKVNEIKKKLRSELKRWKAIEYSYQQCLAYLAGRIAANYSAICKVFFEIKVKMPTFQPESLFDFGSGVGSSIWAAHTEWGQSIKEYFCVDASPEMNEIAHTLLQDETTEDLLIKPVFFRQFLPASEAVKYDMVVSAFSLLDLPNAKDRLRVIDTLWRKTKDILVIIEVGNNSGFSAVLDARDYILRIESESVRDYSGYSSGAHVVCPCPHDFDCPRFAAGVKKPCGIYVSYQSVFPRQHSVAKKDWISYVVIKKGNRIKDDLALPRVVKPVLKKARHAICGLCCADGKLHDIIVTKSKHGRNAYRCARSSNIGDTLPVTVHMKTDFENEETQTLSISESDMYSDFDENKH